MSKEYLDEAHPKCPHCGYVDQDVFEIQKYNPNWIPGEPLVVECPSCERKYTLQWNISYDTAEVESNDNARQI